MGKILCFFVATAIISVLLLLPLIYLFESIADLITQVGAVQSLKLIWQEFVWLGVVLVLAVATLVALFLWEVK